MKKCIQTPSPPKKKKKKIYFSDRTSERKREKVIFIKWGPPYQKQANQPCNWCFCLLLIS